MVDRPPPSRPGPVPHGARADLERAGSRRGLALALLIGDPYEHFMGDPYFPRLIRGMDAVLVPRDAELLMVGVEGGSGTRRAESYLSPATVDGVALVSVASNHPLPGALTRRGLPVVFVGRPADAERFSYVDVDNVAGAAHAVAHLAGGGRRTIAIITGRHDISASGDRLLGYRQGIEAAGLSVDPALIEAGDFTREGAMRAMGFLLMKRPQLDAVFVASDLMAGAAMEVLAREGRHVPEDVAVVGYDDDPLAASLQPPLTSVRQPVEDQGREAARLLLAAIGSPNQPARSVILSTRLEVRASSAPVAPRTRDPA